MKHNKLKLTKIIEELLNYFFSKDFTNIEVNISQHDDYYRICFRDRNINLSQNEIVKLEKMLRISKQEAMEEYYWCLAGECDVDTELSLIGMMTDKSEVKYSKEEGLEIVLYRYKDK